MEYLLAHLFGDFIIQNDWMAKGKKRSSWICLVHVIFYLIPFALITDINPVALFLIGVQHFLQDRWNFVVWFMNNTGQAEFAKPPMAPWSIIVVDNIIHLLFIYQVA